MTTAFETISIDEYARRRGAHAQAMRDVTAALQRVKATESMSPWSASDAGASFEDLSRIDEECGFKEAWRDYYDALVEVAPRG